MGGGVIFSSLVNCGFFWVITFNPCTYLHLGHFVQLSYFIDELQVNRVQPPSKDTGCCVCPVDVDLEQHNCLSPQDPTALCKQRKTQQLL